VAKIAGLHTYFTKAVKFNILIKYESGFFTIKSGQPEEISAKRDRGFSSGDVTSNG
jgi:hypothetical protein